MTRIIVSLVCLLLLSTVFPPEPARAIPFYKNVFDGMYRPRSGAKTTCAICHPSKSKRILNRYGTALTEELGESNVRDREAVERALKAIEHLLPKTPKRQN